MFLIKANFMVFGSIFLLINSSTSADLREKSYLHFTKLIFQSTQLEQIWRNCSSGIFRYTIWIIRNLIMKALIKKNVNHTPWEFNCMKCSTENDKNRFESRCNWFRDALQEGSLCNFVWTCPAKVRNRSFYLPRSAWCRLEACRIHHLPPFIFLLIGFIIGAIIVVIVGGRICHSRYDDHMRWPTEYRHWQR